MVKKEFSKFAKEYSKKNFIQKQVIKKETSHIKNRNILDLGCGNGSLLEFIKPTNYIGIDFSREMLKLHSHKNIFEFDFNTIECWNFIQKQNFDILVSFSALQWANNLDFIFEQIKKIDKDFILVLFTSNTFKTIHKTANINSPIHSKNKIIESSKILNPQIEISNYKLHFEDKLEMFRYIKQSGVSGGEKKLSFKEIKNLIDNYPLDYLEFEVITLKKRN